MLSTSYVFYYFIPNDTDELNTKVHLFLKEAVENGYCLSDLDDRLDVFHDYDVSPSYHTPSDDEECIEVCYTSYDNGDTSITSFTPNFKLNEVKDEESLTKDLLKWSALLGGIFLAGFISGKRKNKLRELKRHEKIVSPRFRRGYYPDVPDDVRRAITNETFDYVWDFMKANDIHFAKRRK